MYKFFNNLEGGVMINGPVFYFLNKNIVTKQVPFIKYVKIFQGIAKVK